MASGGAQKGMAQAALCTPGPPPPLLQDPGTPPSPTEHLLRENRSPHHGPLGGMRPQLLRGTHARPEAKTQSSRPRGRDVCARRPACAPPLPCASQRPFVPPSPGTPVPEKFHEKNQRERQNRASAPRSSGQDRWDRAKVAGGVPSKAEGRVGGSPRNRKSPRLHSGVGEVDFF